MREFHIKQLSGFIFSPTQQAKGRVLLIHGLSEHSGRHSNTIKHLVSSQYEVVTFDLRGSGKSGGIRQWINKFSDYVEDTNSVFNWCLTELSPLPFFVLGHSLGGAIAIYFASERSHLLSGLILSAPATEVGEAVSPIKIKVGRWLAPWVPKMRLKNMDHSAISRDPAVVLAYDQDPLACHFNTLQQGNEILNALSKIGEKAPLIRCPILLVHGSHDKIIPLSGSHTLLSSLKTEDKSLFILPGGYHEPHNDLDKDQYFKHLSQWLDHHLP